MPVAVVPAPPSDLAPWRDLHRHEIRGQVLKDSIPDRPGWTDGYFLELDGARAGYGVVAVGGPWTDRPTVIELYLRPEVRTRTFALFEAFLAASGAAAIETQSDAPLLGPLIHLYAAPLTVDSILFRDEVLTRDVPPGALVRPATPADAEALYPDRRDALGDWVVTLDGVPAGSGGILGHYNRPFEDVYMEVAEPFRRRGLGGYLVQELKRIARERGSIPTARCNPANLASRRTLQKAGFVPFGVMLSGTVVGAHQAEAPRPPARAPIR
jgi:GNAT superfamily N-acetyltransferase